MNWKFLLPLPLAAFAVAVPLRVPTLKPAIPLPEQAGCNYARARESYLEAYAYAQEDSASAGRLLRIAERLLESCGEKAGPLKARASELRQTLTP